MITFVSRVVLLLVALSLVAGGSALAENRMASFTLTPMVGYHKIDGGLNLDDGMSFGLAAGYNITKNWTIEADFRYTPTETDTTNSVDVDVLTLGLGGLYHFRPAEVLNPYLSFGVGGLVYDFSKPSNSDEDYMGYYGGGFKYAITDQTALRFDLRHILDSRNDKDFSNNADKSTRHHLQAMIGLTFQLSGYTSMPLREKRIAAALHDKKPVVVPTDSDHDGVFNALDMCPGTAPGVRVDVKGCPADTDYDGVLDYQDACVDTPQGTSVDSAGCVQQVAAAEVVAAEPVEVDSLTLNVLFGFDKDQVTPFHYSELNKAVEFINKYPHYQVVVEGHTDNRGEAEYNKSLSQRRANSIRQVLVEKYGVVAERISASGYGQEQPLTGNETDEARMQNRRVEISIRP